VIKMEYVFTPIQTQWEILGMEKFLERKEKNKNK